MKVGGGLAWAAQLRWTSDPNSADISVTDRCTSLGGELPPGSKKIYINY